MIQSSLVGRRPLLQAAATLGLAFLTEQPAKAKVAPAASLDPTDKNTQALIFRKLAYSMDEKIGFWWLRSTRVGLVDAVATPLWEMHGGNFFKVKDRGDGNYDVTTLGCTFYTDIKTGAFLREFVNPYTGKTVEVSYSTPKPQVTKFSVDGPETPKTGALSSFVVNNAIGPAWVEGDLVSIRGDNTVYTPPNDPRHIWVNDWATYVGSAADIVNPALKMAPAKWFFVDLLTWPAWLQMGDQPGHYCSRGLGVKETTFDRMPATWRRLMAEQHPDIVKDPEGALKI